MTRPQDRWRAVSLVWIHSYTVQNIRHSKLKYCTVAIYITESLWVVQNFVVPKIRRWVHRTPYSSNSNYVHELTSRRHGEQKEEKTKCWAEIIIFTKVIDLKYSLTSRSFQLFDVLHMNTSASSSKLPRARYLKIFIVHSQLSSVMMKSKSESITKRRRKVRRESLWAWMNSIRKTESHWKPLR